MHPYQHEFLAFASEIGALRFGEFTLKSGRVSPYFFNAGLFDSGAKLMRLGRAFAHCIIASELKFDLLYGPAYKGIPLAAATAIALASEHGRDLPYAFNRKEVKDHGEGGSIVGSPLRGRVLIIDDVITAGMSIGESVEIIRAAGAELAGVVIALDRQERGQGALSAAAEVEQRFGVPVQSVAALADLIEFLSGSANPSDATTEAVRRYRECYGV